FITRVVEPYLASAPSITNEPVPASYLFAQHLLHETVYDILMWQYVVNLFQEDPKAGLPLLICHQRRKDAELEGLRDRLQEEKERSQKVEKMWKRLIAEKDQQIAEKEKMWERLLAEKDQRLKELQSLVPTTGT
ncbi:hypothetical protein HK102_009903, partial [Quaeritorhiza haematococci]